MVRHICYVISKLGVGGAEKNLLLLTRNIPRDRFAPVVLSLNGEGAYAEFLRRAGVPVYSLGFPHPKWIWRLIRFFARCRFDLFHGFMFHGNLASRIFGTLLGRPAISAVRVAEGEKAWHVRIDRMTSWMVDRYTANSRSLAEFVAKHQGVPAGKITVIPNALSEQDRDIPAGASARSAARRALGVPENCKLVAMVGRLHIQKDPETFVRAAGRIAGAVDGTQFLIAGVGPLEDCLRKMIQDANLQNSFHIGGLVESRAVYSACDVFVLPSRWEGFPNAAIEAMAAGNPVVLSDFPGASEVVDYGVTGLVFPRGDDKSLAGAVIGILQNANLARDLGRKARETALARYTVEGLVQGNLSLYAQLTEDAGAL